MDEERLDARSRETDDDDDERRDVNQRTAAVRFRGERMGWDGMGWNVVRWDGVRLWEERGLPLVGVATPSSSRSLVLFRALDNPFQTLVLVPAGGAMKGGAKVRLGDLCRRGTEGWEIPFHRRKDTQGERRRARQAAEEVDI